jgi:hypothetical protein
LSVENLKDGRERSKLLRKPEYRFPGATLDKIYKNVGLEQAVTSNNETHPEGTREGKKS